MVHEANPKISALKGLGGIVIIFLSLLISGLTNSPDLVPVWGGVLIAVLNFIKHFGIGQGWWS